MQAATLGAADAEVTISRLEEEIRLLERLVAVTTLPARGELPEAPPPDPAATPSFLVPARPRVNLAALASTPASATARRVGLLARLLAFFGR